MKQERFSGLAFMQIHRSQIPNPEVVLNELAKSSRKLSLLLKFKCLSGYAFERRKT